MTKHILMVLSVQGDVGNGGVEAAGLLDGGTPFTNPLLNVLQLGNEEVVEAVGTDDLKGSKVDGVALVAAHGEDIVDGRQDGDREGGAIDGGGGRGSEEVAEEGRKVLVEGLGRADEVDEEVV